MQLAADQLVGALGLEPRREPDLAVLGVVGDPRLQRRIIGAADGNASHMELEHGGEMGSRYEKASPSRSWPFRFHADKTISRRASPPRQPDKPSIRRSSGTRPRRTRRSRRRRTSVNEDKK